MAKRAGAEKLGLLHEKLAEVMLDALDGEKITDEDGNETVFKATNPALFTAIAKFLKDNDIVAIPETDDAVKRLKDKLLANNKSTLPLPSKEDIQWHNGNQPH
jgi:hypothetical protein